jgi:hypothetical protein
VYIGFVVFILGWIFQTVQLAGNIPYATSTYYRWGWGRLLAPACHNSSPLAAVACDRLPLTRAVRGTATLA